MSDAGKLKAIQSLDMAHTAERFALQNWERANSERFGANLR